MSLRISRTRIVLALVLFTAVFFAPWWITLAFAAVIAVRFRAWEVVGAGVLYDILWLPAGAFISFDAIPLATLVAIALVFIFEPLRRQLLIE